MQNYRLRVVLLSLGVLFGFGSGFASLSHRHDRCDYHHHGRDYRAHADYDRDVDEHPRHRDR